MEYSLVQQEPIFNGIGQREKQAEMIWQMIFVIQSGFHLRHEQVLRNNSCSEGKDQVLKKQANHEENSYILRRAIITEITHVKFLNFNGIGLSCITCDALH